MCWNSATFVPGKCAQHVIGTFLTGTLTVSSTSHRHNRRPRQVEFYTSSWLIHDVQTKRLHIVLTTEFTRTMLRSSKCVLANCFQMPFSEETPNFVLRVTPHLSIYLFTDLIFSRPFFFLRQTELFTPIRHGSVNTKLIYRMNNSEQEFCVR